MPFYKRVLLNCNLVIVVIFLICSLSGCEYPVNTSSTHNPSHSNENNYRIQKKHQKYVDDEMNEATSLTEPEISKRNIQKCDEFNNLESEKDVRHIEACSFEKLEESWIFGKTSYSEVINYLLTSLDNNSYKEQIYFRVAMIYLYSGNMIKANEYINKINSDIWDTYPTDETNYNAIVKSFEIVDKSDAVLIAKSFREDYLLRNLIDKKSYTLYRDAIESGFYSLKHTEYEKAIKNYKKALNIYKYSIEALSGLFKVYLQMNNSEKIKDTCENILIINNESTDGLNCFGKYYELIDNKDKALEYYRRILSIDPDNVRAQNNIDFIKSELFLDSIEKDLKSHE